MNTLAKTDISFTSDLRVIQQCPSKDLANTKLYLHYNYDSTWQSQKEVVPLQK